MNYSGPKYLKGLLEGMTFMTVPHNLTDVTLIRVNVQGVVVRGGDETLVSSYISAEQDRILDAAECDLRAKAMGGENRDVDGVDVDEVEVIFHGQDAQINVTGEVYYTEKIRI